MRVLLLFGFCVPWLSSGQEITRDYSPLLDKNTSAVNPGIYLRIMPNGLAYLREVGMKVINEQILKLQLPNIREPIENGEVRFIDNLTIKHVI